MNYYHCLSCEEIPLIIIKRNNIIIKCKKHGLKSISIEDYYNKCIEKCAGCNQNFTNYLYNNKFFCFLCMDKLGLNNTFKYNYLNRFLSCKIHNSFYYDCYCNDCQENKCKLCKKMDSQNHYYIPDKISYENHKKLRKFITTIGNKIEEIENILLGIKLVLEIYKSLLYDKNFIINKEIIDNFNNLDIIKDIKNLENKEEIFTMKMNIILKELENFKYLEFSGINQNLDKNFLINNIIPKDNRREKLIMKELMDINENNILKNNNGIVQEINGNKKKRNKTIYIHKKQKYNNIKLNNNNQMGIYSCLNNFNNLKDNYQNNNKIEIAPINENDLEENKIIKDWGNIFKSPKNKLYQNYAIKLEDIENKSQYIINKIINISQIIEDEIDDVERNNYLLAVGNIARVADNYSNELSQILIKRFFTEYKGFSSIFYENAKIELSSWVNQSLKNDESNKDIKQLKYFYSFYSDKEKSRIINYIISDEKVNSILMKNNYNLYNLFRDLSQLYTEALLYSEKEIFLKYVEKCEFDYNKMIDATELNGRRYVKFTILPGLFVCKYNINNGKIFVFCSKKLENNDNNPFSDNLPKNKKLYLPQTIKRNEIKEKISCNIQFNYTSNTCQIYIVTKPNISQNDHPKYLLTVISETKKHKEISSEKPEFIFKKKDCLNKKIYGTVEINGEKIKSNDIILRGIK